MGSISGVGFLLETLSDACGIDRKRWEVQMTLVVRESQAMSLDVGKGGGGARKSG